MAMYAPNQLHAVPLAELSPIRCNPEIPGPAGPRRSEQSPEVYNTFSIRKYARTGTIKA